MAFAAATGWRIVSNTYPVQPAISLIDSNLAIMMPPYEKPETVAPADLKLEVQLLVEVRALRGLGGGCKESSLCKPLLLVLLLCGIAVGGSAPPGWRVRGHALDKHS